MKPTHSSKAAPRGLLSKAGVCAQAAPSCPPLSPPAAIPRYLLPGEQDVGQVFADLC